MYFAALTIFVSIRQNQLTLEGYPAIQCQKKAIFAKKAACKSSQRKI